MQSRWWVAGLAFLFSGYVLADEAVPVTAPVSTSAVPAVVATAQKSPVTQAQMSKDLRESRMNVMRATAARDQRRMELERSNPKSDGLKREIADLEKQLAEKRKALDVLVSEDPAYSDLVTKATEAEKAADEVRRQFYEFMTAERQKSGGENRPDAKPALAP